MLQEAILLLSSLFLAARAQQVPSLTWQKCTAINSCTTGEGRAVMDANWRWGHSVNDSTNCYTGNTWDSTLCLDNETCAVNWLLMEPTIAVSTDECEWPECRGSSTFDLLGNEFTFDVIVANLPCGLNGALHFSRTQADSGISRFANNKAGANMALVIVTLNALVI
ncbi:1,4-beta-D-glucan cellobiohydrolase A [Talaromyces pinophilus]|nr:1,4-beta-D-glucan cellobiohydrolase A [Talaromyces pinophilus]